MLNKHFIVIVVIFIYSTGCSNKIKDYESALLSNVIETVNDNHLAPAKMDDELSGEIFLTFMEFLDPEKTIFLQKEVEQLKSLYLKRNNPVENPSLAFIDEVYNIMKKGILRGEKYTEDNSTMHFEILQDDYFELAFDEIDFANKKELKSRWSQTVKHYFVKKLLALDTSGSQLSFEEKKSMAANQTEIFFNNYFNSLNNKTIDDLTELYLNAVVSQNDHQSRFLSPETKEEWDDIFNRSYSGIGVNIETTSNYPVIKNVVYKGPSWNTGKININDKILNVSNKDNQLVDVAGMPLKQVIDLLRGKTGTKVTIRRKNSNDQIEDISITRGKIPMSKAMSFVIEAPDNKLKLGYIFLPRFYSTGNGASTDVYRELKYLKKQNIDGIVLDLRNNWGGSASEAREIVGYFLKGEPIMQMVYADGEHRVFNDNDDRAVYSGKLIVMVNEQSSSGSELVAGTLQDYGRAIIVGNQTYGKGTAQNYFELIDDKSLAEIGHLKLTIASFYTGKGRSTQFNGVIPDIVLPSKNMYVKTGERKVDNVLKFKDINPLTINENQKKKIQKLEALSYSRQEQNSYFQEILKTAQLNKERKDNTLINLNYNVYKQEQAGLNLDSNVDLKDTTYYTISDSGPGFGKENMDYWRPLLESDAYINEARLIMDDYLQLIDNKGDI